MRIIVGLGNPGAQYIGTRHNAGIMFVERLGTSVQRLGDYGWRRKNNILVCETDNLILVRSEGIFMNESGRIIYELRTMNYELSNLYIAHDDLDIRLGEYKIQRGIGPKVHYGVQSVENALGTKDLWRIRIGVDNRFPNANYRIPGEEYVLQKFTPEEKKVIERVIGEIAESLISPPHSPS